MKQNAAIPTSLKKACLFAAFLQLFPAAIHTSFAAIYVTTAANHTCFSPVYVSVAAKNTCFSKTYTSFAANYKCFAQTYTCFAATYTCVAATYTCFSSKDICFAAKDISIAEVYTSKDHDYHIASPLFTEKGIYYHSRDGPAGFIFSCGSQVCPHIKSHFLFHFLNQNLKLC